MTTRRKIRQAQTLSPFGVGGILDLAGESIVACDTRRWKDAGTVLHLPRLERALRVAAFRAAPPESSSPADVVPYYRFPRWLFCSTCRRMYYWKDTDPEDDAPACSSCRGHIKLVPMRFVAICEVGHLCDVPWREWAHSKTDISNPKQRQCGKVDLEFRSSAGRGGGLDSLSVRCRSCDASRSLEDITRSGVLSSLRERGGCPGKQPWEPSSPGCPSALHVVQRGASNVYFARTWSALDIPPQSDWPFDSDMTSKVKAHDLYSTIRRMKFSEPLIDSLCEAFAEDLELTEEQVRAALEELRTEEDGSVASALPAVAVESQELLLEEEYLAFLTPRDSQDFRDRFCTRRIALESAASVLGDDGQELAASLTRVIDRVIIATRLREVRALYGFNRYQVGESYIPVNLEGNPKWMPGIEVYGEGIFLSLNEQRLQQWEADASVIARCDPIKQRFANSFYSSPSVISVEASPRMLLLHSFAHLLIRQLAFECGYSSASLRERIYAREPRPGVPGIAGILVYTSAGDSEGTLGGLARQGEISRLVATLASALQSALWCSTDPICLETIAQGQDGLNRAACQGCSLVAETSCMFSNLLLDRATVIGDRNSMPGYFKEVLETIDAVMSSKVT